MDHDELTERLSEVGLGPKDLPRSTLRNWAREGLIPRSTPYSKLGRRGRFRNWPEETVEEAAAVWALRNPKRDRFYAKPTLDTIRRVRSEATWVHKKFKTDPVHQKGVYQEFYNTRGERHSYLRSYDLHDFIVTWIVTIEKVRRKKSVHEPANVIFNWRWHVGQGNKEELICEVILIRSTEDGVLWAFGYTPEELEQAEFDKNIVDRDPLRTKALAELRAQGIDVDSMAQESPEFRELLSETIVKVSDGLVKRAKKSEWGIDPWILDDLGLLGKSEEEIEAALREIEEEHEQRVKGETGSSD